ncbi:MAG TPA: flagellar biosynthetic protein FliR [Pirellulales bacterium]|jgi:flagellar biosynthetic protein FliR|nr:flagellar biosynthetic protein FliR [Pirellulales bacterium]
MDWILEYGLHLTLVFSLVFGRVAGLVMTAPVFGSSDVPKRIRIMLALALAALVTPLQKLELAHDPQTPVDYLLLIGGETLIGVTIGVGITLLFSGLQVAGQIINQMSGMQLADIYNPALHENVPIFSQLLYYVALAVFVTIGGHHRVMSALLDSFASLPPGGGTMPTEIGEMLTTLAAQSFRLGVQAATPIMVAMLLATLVVGLISRTLPQLNVMHVGFGINSMITLCAVALSMGAMAWVFQEQVDPMLNLLVEIFRG